MMSPVRSILLVLLVLIAGTLPAAPARAQTRRCAVICAPSFHLMPGIIRSHLFRQPRVRMLADGSVKELPSTTNAELIFSVAAPTAIARTSLIMSFQWLPSAKASANPFTEYTASQLGDTKIRANTPSVTLGASFAALTADETGGWLALSPYVADLYSSAARPRDESAFTHKLDVGLSGTVGVLSWLPPTNWLHQVSVYTILDYVATGLPRAGDVTPRDERVFLTSARPASLIVGLAIPIAPLDPKSK